MKTELALAHPRDRRLVAAALVHGAGACALAALCGRAPVPPAMLPLLWAGWALAMCWNANTISHLHLHRPLFGGRWGAAASAVWSLYLTVLLGIPQRLWQQRHLAHHQLPDPRGRALGRGGVIELGALAALVAALALLAPRVLLALWLPGTALGFALCALQGWAEHHQGAGEGVDHHGRVYNWLWFNDGFHAAHHRAPAAHWSALPADAGPLDRTSRWPPLLRWLTAAPALGNQAQARSLDLLERAALRLRPLRALLLSSHRPALAKLLATLPGRGASLRQVVVVGGGLYPRSVLLLAALLPEARFTILDDSEASLALVHRWLPEGLWGRVQLHRARYVAGQPLPVPCDLLVIPLAFRGDRLPLYRRPPVPLALVHDWWWRRPDDSGQVAASAGIGWLGKRINLVPGPPTDGGNSIVETAGCAARPADSPARAIPGNVEPPLCSRPNWSHASDRATTTPS